MLFDSSLRKELARSFVATLLVLVTVVMSMMLIRMLGSASRGSVDPRDVIFLMGYAVLGHLPTILTLSLFISVCSTLSRLYRESEMAVWFASGQGLLSFTKPLLRFAWPILLAISVLALWVWPWSNQQSLKMKQQYEQRGDVDRVAPGKFQENASGKRVFYVEGGSLQSSSVNTNTLTVAADARNVFVSSHEGDKQVVTSAQRGKLQNLKGDQFLVLNNGQRIDQTTGQAELKITQFETYSSLVNPNKVQTQEPAAKAMHTLELIQAPNPQHDAELAWRLSLIACAFNLLLAALALTAVNPRAGRGMGLGLALLSFVVYYNLINVGFSRISSGRAGFASWMLALHGGIFLLIMLWLWLRHINWSWRNALPSRSAAPQPQGASA